MSHAKRRFVDDTGVIELKWEACIALACEACIALAWDAIAVIGGGRVSGERSMSTQPVAAAPEPAAQSAGSE